MDDAAYIASLGERDWLVRIWDSYLGGRRIKYPLGQFPGFVYFIQSGRLRGPIKIGYTGHQSVARRMGELQTSSPYPLSLLAWTPGDTELEATLHGWFSYWRLEGEWFRARSYGLRELIDHINSRLPV